ncbi:MAG: hypothetical protein JW874_05335 [Spirochaetales bacterium]|nr:hypothetical protein [Spirochaetales bacterium]
MNTFFNKMNCVLWYAGVIMTGIMAGFLCSHSVMLGRFFNWTLHSGNGNFFRDLFSVFRAESRANVHYNLFLWVSMLVGILWLISCLLAKKNRILAATAGISTFWVGFVFFASGFAGAEDAVASGGADRVLTDLYLKLNLPLHTSFALFYLASFLFLLIMGSRTYGSKAERQ